MRGEPGTLLHVVRGERTVNRLTREWLYEASREERFVQGGGHEVEDTGMVMPYTVSSKGTETIGCGREGRQGCQ